MTYGTTNPAPTTTQMHLRNSTKTNVSWQCYKCESVNVSSFSFHSYEFIKPNRFEPLSQLDDPFEQTLLSDTFNPRYISSPTNKSFGPKASYSTLNSTEQSFTHNFPKKQNLRVMNINCRSLLDKKSEFQTVLDYTKPDIVMGTESWLEGIKPGKVPTQ